LPFSRPTLSQLRDRAFSYLDDRVEGGDSRLRRSFLNVLALALAGLVHGLYGFLEFMFRQCFPDTAEAEYLARWASIWGVIRKAATKATGTTQATGTNGSSIASGTELTRSDGVRFKTTALATISGGIANLAIEALDVGIAGNTLTGALLTFVSTPSGVNATTTVQSPGLSGGADTEDDESLLGRLLDRIQTPPQGGSAEDYVTWALEVAGVTRAWCYPMELGTGTVTVRFMMDDTYANGIPLAGDVTTVQNYIDARRPVTADVTVVAPTAVPLAFTIDLLANDTPAIRAAVEAELKDMLRRDAVPGGTILISHIREAISIATGETDHVLTVPAGNVTHTTGQIATMGTITWT
jgi:uncharacterized phage protein gp47/JayE